MAVRTHSCVVIIDNNEKLHTWLIYIDRGCVHKSYKFMRVYTASENDHMALFIYYMCSIVVSTTQNNNWHKISSEAEQPEKKTK